MKKAERQYEDEKAPGKDARQRERQPHLSEHGKRRRAETLGLPRPMRR
jgi:hypothetical protein